MNAILVSRFHRYLEQHSLSRATIRNYLADLRAFARWQAARPNFAPSASRADFSAYREHLCHETDHSTATVNRRLQSLRLFGRFLHEAGLAEENPACDIELVRNGNGSGPVPRTLNPNEIARLLDAIPGGRPSLAQRDFAIMQMLLNAGLRVHEIAELRMRDVIRSARGVRVEVHANGNGVRVLPLNAIAARALRDYLAARQSIPQVDHLFLSQRGRPLSTRSIQRLIDNYARAAGLEGVSAQALRHTCARTMLENTRDPALVARWLGHRDVRTLDRYAIGK